MKQWQALNIQLIDPEMVAWLKRYACSKLGASIHSATTRDEEWRFTDLSSAAGYIPGVSAEGGVADSDVSALPEAGNSRLVFVNGVCTRT